MHVTYIDVPERVSPQIAPRLGGTRARDGRASTESDRFTRRRGETNRNETNETNIIIDTLAELSHFFLLFFFPLFLSSLFTFRKHSRISRPWRFDTRLLSVPIRADFRESSMSLALGRGWGGDRGQTGGRLALDFDTHVARKGRIYHTRGLLIMAIVIIIIIIIIIIVIPKGVIRYRDS